MVTHLEEGDDASAGEGVVGGESCRIRVSSGTLAEEKKGNSRWKRLRACRVSREMPCAFKPLFHLIQLPLIIIQFTNVRCLFLFRRHRAHIERASVPRPESRAQEREQPSPRSYGVLLDFNSVTLKLPVSYPTLLHSIKYIHKSLSMATKTNARHFGFGGHLEDRLKRLVQELTGLATVLQVIVVMVLGESMRGF